MIKGIGKVGKWKTIAAEGNMQMKYDTNSPIPKSWNNIALVQFKNEITTTLILKKTLDEEGYCVD